MKTKGYYQRWLLPKLDLNVGTRYEGLPVGNSPEMMPMDASLNKDVDDGVHRHIVFTNHLPADDPRKFSMSTPKRGLHAYLRVWNTPAVDGAAQEGGCPGSKRIIEDTDKFLFAIQEIRKFKGCIVPGLGERKGHRGEESRPIAKRGGARVTLTPEEVERRTADMWTHPDAAAARGGALVESLQRWQSQSIEDVIVEAEGPDDFEEDESVLRQGM
jgi:hypothetical protein